MAILVFNSGSSSLKFKLYAAEADVPLLARGSVTSFGGAAIWALDIAGNRTHGQSALHDHGDAAQWVLQRLKAHALTAIGHRVVHGGEEFSKPARLTPATLARLEALSELAPLHNPPALAVIHACRRLLGDKVPMAAVFDTAFHAALPATARHYAVPQEWVRAHGIRRYGFHGLAHRYMYERYLLLAGKERGRVIAFQLGNGCSATAIRDGVSIDTSMGYTPLEGLIMGTRCGDLDAGVVLRLADAGIPAAALQHQLNHASGLLALSGESGDMRALLALAARGHGRAQLAIDTFCHRARKYLGAYLAVLGGADAILFGGGIGEHAPQIRARICEGMEWCGLRLDPSANANAGIEQRLSADDGSVAVYAIAVDEEVLIARDVRQLLNL